MTEDPRQDAEQRTRSAHRAIEIREKRRGVLSSRPAAGLLGHALGGASEVSAWRRLLMRLLSHSIVGSGSRNTAAMLARGWKRWVLPRPVAHRAGVTGDAGFLAAAGVLACVAVAAVALFIKLQPARLLWRCRRPALAHQPVSSPVPGPPPRDRWQVSVFRSRPRPQQRRGSCATASRMPRRDTARRPWRSAMLNRGSAQEKT